MTSIINGVEYSDEEIRTVGAAVIGGDITLTGGGTIKSTANGNIGLVPHGTGITQIGDAGSTSHSLAANDDLFVSGKVEIDGTLYLDGTTIIYANVTALDDVGVILGSGSDCIVRFSTGQTPDTLLFGVGVQSNSLIVCEFADRDTDFANAIRTDPTTIHQSSDATEVTERDYLSWNEHTIGGGKGSYCGIKSITEEVTIAVGEGATPVKESTGDLAPANSLILGAVARITDAPGGGATTVDIGVTGSGNLDTLVDGMSTALNTTATTPVDGDGTQLPLTNGAAATLTLTTDGDVTGDDMKVRVSVFYMEFTPFTA